MKAVLTPREAAELDRETQARGISTVDLMERAGRAVARATAEVAGGTYGRRAVRVCGPGNNGGDGIVAARHLARMGMRVDVVAVEAIDGSVGPASSNLARMSEQGLVARGLDGLEGSLARADVVVDA